MNSRTLWLKASGLLPIDRVRSLGQHDELGAGDMCELLAHDLARRLQILRLARTRSLGQTVS